MANMKLVVVYIHWEWPVFQLNALEYSTVQLDPRKALGIWKSESLKSIWFSEF